MEQEKEPSLYQTQKQSKPKIEDLRFLAPGTHETILDREFEHVCHAIKAEFHGSDDATPDYIMIIVDYKRDEILELASKCVPAAFSISATGDERKGEK